MKNIFLLQSFLACLLCALGCDDKTETSVEVEENSKDPSGIVLSTFEESGVKVTFSLEAGEGGRRWIRATFAPLEKGLHVYSKDLPAEGIDGIGRPTLLALTPHPSVTEVGELSADKEVHNLASPLNADGFPVYPDGPVTLTLPFTLKADANGSLEATVRVTYMACTKTFSNPPVENKDVKVVLN